MADLLFLAHRVPFPPDKGDKIRAYHALRHLARRFTIHLGCFADAPEDEKFAPQLREICASLCVVPLQRRSGLVRGLYGLARGASFSEFYFRDERMTRWVKETMARVSPENIFVYCSAMAPYAMPYRSSCRAILDMVDVDSEKWRAYARTSAWPMNLVYAREARALLALERSAAHRLTRTLLVSEAEANVFRRLAPEAAGSIGHYDNGVNLDYFDPTLSFENPFGEGSEPIVFTGSMDYRPNIEAVEWFAKDIFPRIRALRAHAQFWIVGANPAPQIVRLARTACIHVTGRVADVRPYLAHAACAVAPLRIARGVQNKVLEAMAMGKAVIATPAAHEGIAAIAGEELLVADGTGAFADAVISVLSGNAPGLGGRARARVEAGYDWACNLAVLDHIFADASDPLTRSEAEPAKPVAEAVP